MDAHEFPRVSVIIPAYNHDRYVESALDSVKFEGYPNIEIVLIDDGSTDRTWEIVSAWQHAHAGSIPMHTLRQKNAGLTATLNRLLAIASGEYVTMLASDDRLLPGGIAVRVAYLEERRGCMAVFGDARIIDARGRVTSEHAIGYGYKGARRRLLRDPAREIVAHWGVPGPVILYRREPVLTLGGYSEDLELEDWDLYLRLASIDAIAYVDTPVAEYRWHGNNTVAKPETAVRLTDELRAVAWRSRNLFRGHLRLELIHESTSLAARSAWLRRRLFAWLGWKATSVSLKLLASVVPRRPSDQAGRTIRPEVSDLNHWAG